MRLRAFLLASALAILASGCARPSALAPVQAAPTLQGDASHPGSTQGWLETELYFGLGPADHPEQGITGQQWTDFLDREVTPRFPAGLSVADVYGQWLGQGKTTPSRLRSKMLIILHADTAENRDKIEAIRAAWKQLHGDRSVLRVTKPADVSF
jgi:hypothetical protein